MTEEERDKCSAYVLRERDKLSETYVNRYIAVHPVKMCVVDSDENEYKLAGRMDRLYPRDFVLIGTIESILNPEEDFIGTLKTTGGSKD